MRFGSMIGLILCAALTCVAVAQDDAKLKRLVERIATGDEGESADATEQLAEYVLDPLTKAIGSMEKRPGAKEDRTVEEILRLRRAISKINSGLRIRLARLDLPDEDRKLFDPFVRAYPELTESLFADNYMVRKWAVGQVPLDRDTGAGVMVCLRVNDEEASVAMDALEVAEKLKDAVVARGLLRYLADATRCVQMGVYKESQADLLAALATIIDKAIQAVIVARPAEAAPVLGEAYRTFAQLKYWNATQRSGLARKLGELGDERIAPVLLTFMAIDQQAEFRAGQGGALATLTVGDAALLGLTKLYGLKPADVGFAVIEESGEFCGFFDNRAREVAHRRFRGWYSENAEKPREQRSPISPAPESKPSP